MLPGFLPPALPVASLMPNPVVITRPVAQTTEMAQRMAAFGRQAIVFPLLEIHPLEDTLPLQKTLSRLDDYALVAFVSPNAIDAALCHLQEWPAGVAIGIIGEGSRAALARHGISGQNARIVCPHDAERTDSETLLEAMDLPSLKNKRVLIVRGESGRELLADGLRAAGVNVTQIAAYRRMAPAVNRAVHEQLTSLLATKHDWLITSSESLRILVNMVTAIAGRAGVVKIQREQIYVPHYRIAETAASLGFANVRLTGSGDEKMLAALQSVP